MPKINKLGESTAVDAIFRCARPQLFWAMAEFMALLTPAMSWGDVMTAVDSELFMALDGAPRKPKLLIVDDQPHNIQVLYQIFSGDYQVFMATSGTQALAVCREQTPDLMLVDVVMDGMDGYEVCRRVKEDPRTRDIPVIFVTAHSDPKEETTGLSIGAVDFIAKPINPDVVKARVKTHVKLKLQSELLRRMVFVDGLTGVFNRRYFDHYLSSEWLRANRNHTSMGLLLVDVDHFKRFNDRYGHQAGDDCLRRVAGALKRGLKRPADVAVRYGGEEFACLLPETDLVGAFKVGQYLEQQNRSLAIPHEASDTAPVVTVSMGVAVRTDLSPSTFDELIAQADEQLYRAKEEGRGRVCAAAL